MNLKTGSQNPIELILTAYGPYAFGVVSLLTIWFVIVAPELRNRQMDFSKQMEILQQQKDLAETMRATASTMQITAASLEATTTVLDGMVTND